MLPTRAPQRRRVAAPAAAAAAGGGAAAGAMADDRLFTIICNLDCVSLTGWKRIVASSTAANERRKFRIIMKMKQETTFLLHSFSRRL